MMPYLATSLSLAANLAPFIGLYTRAMIWTRPLFYPATKMSQNGRVNQNLSEGESNEEYYCIRH